jgi:hypothetical protein
MPSWRDIEGTLYAEVEKAAERHQSAKDELTAIARSEHEDDPRTRYAERILRNTRMALLAALQRYNGFVSGGIAPEKLKLRIETETGGDAPGAGLQIAGPQIALQDAMEASKLMSMLGKSLHNA